MIYRTFGRTGIRMPVISCGGMRYQQSWDASDAVTRESQDNLQATIDRAFALGIFHIETARGYGTSEAQLGEALERVPRDQLILQTKVAPLEDPKEFERHVGESFERLRMDRVDLFAYHGVNHAGILDHITRPGGCHEVIQKMRDEGRIGHVGFSTHGTCQHIVRAIETGLFDYVNLHWYFIFQDNHAALEAARARDMGVFIISPSDKGGKLYAPPDTLRELCEPFSPMVFNDLFCLSQDEIHTISLGAARPSDFDEHMKAVSLLGDAKRLLPPVIERLDDRYGSVHGADFASSWAEGIPDWDSLPGGINVRAILWLRNLVKAFGLLDYGKMRYNLLSKNDHWFPGNKASDFDDTELRNALVNSPHASEIPAMLREAHEWLDEPSTT